VQRFMVQRFMRWLQSRRGIASASLALLVTAGVASNGSVSVAALPLAFAVYLLVAVGLVWVVSRVWDGHTWPATPRFAREEAATGSRQLREDTNASVYADRGGFLFARRHFFMGTGCPPVRLPECLPDLAQQQLHEPVLIATTAARRYWWYRNQFSWENQGLAARDVQALLHERERRRTRQLEHAHTMLRVEQGQGAAPQRQRQPIPRELRQAVFARDGGRCVDCGSNFDIQYDHVIPWSMGGADSYENLQLLCGRCNQAKGASL